MAVAYRGVSNAAGQNAGTTTTASTVAITPTVPGGTVATDRVIIFQEHSAASSATTPAGWTVIGTKDLVVGTGAVSAGGGQRRVTAYYRDYDGYWTMPSFALTSAAQNSHWLGAVSLSKAAGEIWDTPTISAAGTDYGGTINVSYSATTGSLTTHNGGLLVVGNVHNDNVTITSGALSQAGATLGTLTERADGGTATGNDVSGSIYTCPVTTGASAALAFTGTLSAASEGATIIIEQTVSIWAGPVFVSGVNTPIVAGVDTYNSNVPPGVAANDIVVCVLFLINTTTIDIATPPTGFTQVSGDSPVRLTGEDSMMVYWKRATGADAGTYTWTLTGESILNAYTVCYRNVITSGDPWDTDTSSATNLDIDTTPAVSITTTGANELVIFIATSQSDYWMTVEPTGFFIDDQNGNANVDFGYTFGSKPQAVAGATGSVNGTWNASHFNSGLVWLGALKPEPTAAAEPARAYEYSSVAVHRASLY